MAAIAAINLAEQRRRREVEIGQEYSFANIGELCAFVQHEIVISKLKYSAIAAQAGCCPQTVGRMAAGETHEPRASTALKILSVLGFTLVARNG